MSSLPTRVGVLGGGTMGVGIAHAFLIKGCEVVVVERDPAAAAVTGQRIDKALFASVERGVLDNAEPCTEAVSLTTDIADLGGCGLVVEAVPEVMEVKVEALRAAEAALTPEAFLASNTSSLSISELAERLDRPSSFCGLHFFNPVPSSSLVEIVVGARTRPELTEAARDWVSGLGKSAIVVTDAPGFASSRLGVQLALEAMRMLEEGVASAADIDRAMEQGYKHPVGPLRTTDIVGLDVRLGIADYLHSTLGERFAPPQILRDKVAAGELGRKTGKGFYDW
ncbi:3-hydroxyacyl-CoA dehydrogenase family protein [Austwickia chelonae]|uniref:3-hydroxyacyl-CoA dehydrogenase family protein n=1 Tax=Austwickia chelonae TaxID=100225 RepID=UPI000E268185|nr:3-hydroxyacyl-CoA dehydrogenase family protein [Austwickia chelonae]